MATENTEQVLSYKGFPLRRSGNELYFGNLTDSHIVFLQILAEEDEGDLTADSTVQVQLLANDPKLPPRARIIKESEKSGLFAALDIGIIWLERALAESASAK